MNRPPPRRDGALFVFFAMLLSLTACGGASKEMMGPSDATATRAEYDVERGGDVSMEAPMAAPMPPPAPVMEMQALAGVTGSYGGDEMFKSEDTRTAQASGGAAPPPPPAPPGRPGSAGDKKPAEASGAVAISGPMLIYTAELTMASFEVIAQIDKIEAISRELGGFLARRDDTSITIRVPSERFDESLRRVQALGDVLHRNVSVQDVTEEFRDTEVQLKNARAIRDRLQELLAKATKVEDSLLIERELGRVTRDLERLEGRLKFLRDRIAFSTLTVVFQPRAVERVEMQNFRLPVNWLYDLGLNRLMNL